ncbi:ribokinase [Alteribacillus sp. YIM 98480]|uniref:ribokinase n=1 Tax=Alteribacillus sp. YIM 98480 TaxID=2606599 RepID=UPI00131E180A|nr:ribokinase [Alteribacillus sp. YIM 98480]
MGNRLVVMGTINMDLIAKVPRFPVVGETIASTKYIESLGGKAANQAIAAKRMGAEVSFVGKLGGDSFGRELSKQLKNEGLDIDQLRVAETLSTGTSMITINEEGENMVVTNLQANAEVSKEEAKHALLALGNADAALLQLEVPPDVIATIITLLKEKNVPIFMNLAPVISFSREIRKLVDVLIVNEIEASQLAGMNVFDKETAKQAVLIIKEDSEQTIVVTMGAAGVLVYSEKQFYFFKAPLVKAVDTTAAGDCFCGALTAYWLKDKDMLKAVEKAVYAASLSVTRYGATTSLPFEKEMAGCISRH